MASPPPSPSTKKSKGRQRVKMVRMEKDSNRQVTFSKRRYGLFKKANELCTLCGAEVAIIVFSPGRKAFSFGHPSVETILKRFILSNSSSSSSSSSLADSDNETLVELAQRSASVRNLNLELNSVSNRLEIARTRSEELNEIKKAKEQLYWWDRDIDELNYQQLAHLRIALEGLKKNVFQHGKNIIMLQASAAVNHFPMVGINYPMIACYDGAMFNTNGEFVGFRRNYY